MSNSTDYWVGDTSYTVNDEDQKDFLKKYPDAKVKDEEETLFNYDVDGENYKVKPEDQEAFLGKYENATLVAGKDIGSAASANPEQNYSAQNQYDDSEFSSESILSGSRENNQQENIEFGAMPSITSEVTDAGNWWNAEEKAVDLLNEKWAVYGFVFSQAGAGSNEVRVQSLYDVDENGERVNQKSERTFQVNDATTSDEMDAWMRQRAEHQGDKLQNLMTHVSVTTEQRQNAEVDMQNTTSMLSEVREAWKDLKTEDGRSFSELSDDELWKQLKQYKEWNKKYLDSNFENTRSTMRYGIYSKVMWSDEKKDEEWNKQWGWTQRHDDMHDLLVSAGLMDGRAGDLRFNEDGTQRKTNFITRGSGSGLTRGEHYGWGKKNPRTGEAERIWGDSGKPKFKGKLSDIYDDVNHYYESRQNFKNDRALREYEKIKQKTNPSFKLKDLEEADIGKIMSSDEFKNILGGLEFSEDELLAHAENSFRRLKRDGSLESNLEDVIEDINKGHTFVKSDMQKELKDMAINRANLLDDKTTQKVNEFNVVHGDLGNIFEELSSSAEYLSNIDPKKRVQEIKEKYDLTTQEGVDAANNEIGLFQKEYLEKYDRYNFLNKKKGQYLDLAKKLDNELGELEVEQKDIGIYTDSLKRNYNNLVVYGNRALNSLTEMGQGLVNAVDWVASIPRETIGLLPEPAQAFLKVHPAIYAVHEVEERGWLDQFNKDVDAWQEKQMSKTQKNKRWEDIKDANDYAEYFGGFLADFAPQLALITATGGASIYAMGASSLGNKWAELNAQNDLWDRSEGFYGNEMSWGGMFLNAGLTGTAEMVFERVTLGQFRAARGLWKQQAKLGFSNYVKNNVFDWKTLRHHGLDIMDESLSEGMTQLTSNFADIQSGLDVGIWDGVNDSLMAGATISKGMKFPSLYKAMAAPFRSKDTNQRVGEIGDKIQELTKQAVDMKIGSKERDAIEREIAELTNMSNRLVQNDIKKVDLLHPSQKKTLIEIEKLNYEARKRAHEISIDKNLTDAQKQKKLSELQEKVDTREYRKDQILKSVDPAAAEANYQRQRDYYIRQIEMANEMGGVETVVEKVGQDEFTDINIRDDNKKGLESKAKVDDAWMQQQAEIEALEGILKDGSLDQDSEAKKDAKKQLREVKKKQNVAKSLLAEGNSYGVMIPVFENGNMTKMRVVLNKDAIKRDGAHNTKAHEFLHALMRNTIKGDPAMREKLDGHLDKIIKSGKIQVNAKVGSNKWRQINRKYQAKLKQYKDSERGEEKLAIISEMVADNELVISQGTMGRFKDTFRRWYNNHYDMDIQFNETDDILNFIKDYEYNRKNNKPSAAFARLLVKGANGRIFEDAKDKKERDAKRSHNRAVDLNRRSNPDLKREFDQFVQNENGSRKYPDNQMFKDSPDFTGAYLNILEGRALDALIAHGMTERGLPPEAIREFTRLTKEEISRRFITNFDITKNDSLFGWLTGVSGGAGMSIIYRAKGDVMKQYKKDKKADQTSIDKPIGEGTRLSDVLQDERDILLENIENQDLSPGRRKIAKEAVNDIKAKDILGFTPEASQSIIQAIQEVDIPLDGLTYKGVKDYLVKVDQKATTEKKVVPAGPLFPVLNTVSAEFGIDPLRILAKQDLNGTQRESAQSYILEKSTNEDGSFNTALLEVLPEGETRSGEATGIANTKLGQLYKTGARLKVSEGASKNLGQKKSQQKRTDVTKEEFLDMFGINPDGSFRKGTKADGAIRALTVAVAQVAANQDMRVHALTNGTATQAEAAALADGVSERMFNRSIDENNIDTFEDEFGNAIGDLSDVNLDNKKDIFNHLRRAYKDTLITDKELKGVANDWYGWHKKFQALKSPKDKSAPVDQYDIQTFIIDQTQRALLDKGLYATLGPKFVTDVTSVTELYNDIERVAKRRGDLVSLGNELLAKDYSKKEVLRIMFLLKGMFGSSATIGDGRFILDSKGDLILDPKWEDSKPGARDGNKWKRNDDGSLKLTKKGNPIPKRNRGQVFKSSQDFINTISKIEGFEDIKGKNWKTIGKEQGVDTGKLFADKSKQALTDMDFNGRKKQADEMRNAVELLTSMYVEGIYNESMQYEDLAMLGKMFGSNMSSPMKKAANLQYVGEGVEKVPVDKRGSELEYEHMVPTNVKIMQLFTNLLNTPSGLPEGFWNDYQVAIIPKKMDKVLIKKGLRDFMQLGYLPGMAPWKRYFNPQTFGEKNLVPIKNIETGKIEGREFVEASKTFPNLDKQNVIVESERMRSRKVPKIKGMSAFDFDETLIIDGKNVIEATNPKTGERETISSEDWPTRGTELMEQGWEFDFSDFINVKGGTKGPLFQKLKNRIQKFGSKNNFILTARPQESAAAIHGWLMANGIYLPPENITGLGNSTGDAKAMWILDKFKEGYNDVYFVDDALPNVQAVKHVMEQLDIKGSSVQAVLDAKGKTLMPEPVADEFTKAAKRAKEQIKIIEEDLKKRGYKILGTTRSSEFRRVGGLKIDLTTEEGRKISRELDEIKTVRSSESERMKSKIVDTHNDINEEFNDILTRGKTKITKDQELSREEGRRMGAGKGKFDFFVPPSAEDFKGLLYKFLGKGKRGDKDMAFFKKHLLDPFAQGIRAYNIYRQNMANDYAALKKAMPSVVKNFNKFLPDSNFTNEDAIRVYLWNKSGFEIPGLSPDIIQKLVEHVEADPDLVGFAEGLSKVTKAVDGYAEPDVNWGVSSIAGDLQSVTRDVGRKDFLKDWIENKDIFFSESNLNKIEAIHGRPTREAFENMLYRMENGTNRPQGQDRVVNKWLNWINGSVGAVMFFNMRSAILQTISMVNFVNHNDNNMFKAAAAFANQPQFWKDFAMIFNSPQLKQRRAGLQIDVNYNELSDAYKGGRSKPEAVIRYLLEKGFLPTQIADSFAIAMGGAPFFRNRYNRYIKEGMTPEQAQEQAWLDFQEIAEETQQSSRPDLISQQQASPLGRLILAWQNTPMQMTRLTKKALSDLVNGRGDPKANISKILYYGLVQNIIFGVLQSGLAFLMFGSDEEEEKKRKKTERVLNGALDTLLRGTGVWGAALSTVKNTVLEFYEQREKGWRSDHTYTIIEATNISPPIGSKLRKVYNAIQTDRFNRGVGEKLKYRIENPTLSIVGNVVEALTNFPMARLINKANNIEEAITGNHELWQRIAMLGGWNRWTVGAKDEELEAAKQEVKDEKAEKKKIEKDKKKEEDKKKKEEEKKAEEEKKKKEGIKTVRCSGRNSSGKRCGMTTETKAKSWKCFHHAEFKDGMDRDGDGIKEYRCTATTSSGKRCKNKTENKNKKCYAHQ